MKTTLLVLLALSLPAAAHAQKPLEPVRVALSLAEEKPSDREFDGHLRDELNKFKDLAITTRRVDFEITTVVTPISERGKIIGYAAAVMVATPERGSRCRFRLSSETGAALPAMARNLALYLDKEFFQARRSKRR